MEQQTVWRQVDRYFEERIIEHDPILEQVLHENRKAGLPAIDVTPLQGKLLQLLVMMHGSRRILEIGTLGGNSTIWMARALPPDGKIVTLELEPRHARVAEQNLILANVKDKVDIRVGPALDQLAKMKEESVEPFDLVFIDADKANIPNYLRWALRFSRPGTVIICDNVVRNGEVINGMSSDPNVNGIRSFFDMLADEQHVTATAVQTVGSKGYDGFSIGIVTA
jgi:Predicted O-methyltransferase